MRGYVHGNRDTVRAWIRRVGADFTISEASEIWGVDKDTMRDWYAYQECAAKDSRKEKPKDFGPSLLLSRVPLKNAAGVCRLVRSERKASRRALRAMTA